MKLRDYREKAGMTQEELANKSGISRVAVSMIETGSIKNPSSKTLLALANALGVTLDQIFFDECG